jgi:6-phosphogluconolactonase
MTRKMALFAALVLLFAGLASAQNFVYTNDDVFGSNTVTGFSVASTGTLTLVSGSPFPTAGSGSGGGYFATNRAKSTSVGNLVFASNTNSNDVSVFTIDTTTGALTLVPGSPFAVGGSPDFAGIALGVTPNGMFLMAANGFSVTVFSIASGGTLTPIAGSPFPLLAGSDGIVVSPNGSFLAAAEGFQVEMMNIASDGSLTSIGGFPAGGGNFLAGVDVNCSSTLLYGGEANGSGTIVDGYSIASSGTLAPLAGSPFMNSLGVNSNVVLLNHIHGKADKLLFVSNQSSNTIEVFHLGKGGGLSLVGPFPMNPPVFFPAGMATNAKGNLLYVANIDNDVNVFSVSSKGNLAEVAGSPFATGQFGGLLSLTSFPPRSCK